MRVLVTGGAGYIGSHAVRVLAARGHEPVVFDDLSRGHRQAVPPGSLIVGSLLDRTKLAAALDARPVDAVMHFAAHWDVGESVREPRKYFRENLGGAINLFEEMLDRGVRYAVLSSTAAVYGEPVSIPIGEDHPRAPINPYGETKLGIETMLRAYDAAYGLRSVCLRYFNAAGADPAGGIGEKHVPETHLIPLVLDAAFHGDCPVTVYGDDYPTSDGTCVRDYVHVSDLAAAHVLALERMARLDRSEVYNLGAGEGRTVMDVIETARRVTGREIPVRKGPRRPGDPVALVADCGRARRDLGWDPGLSSLERIVRTAWEWRQLRDRAFPD